MVDPGGVEGEDPDQARGEATIPLARPPPPITAVLAVMRTPFRVAVPSLFNSAPPAGLNPPVRVRPCRVRLPLGPSTSNRRNWGALELRAMVAFTPFIVDRCGYDRQAIGGQDPTDHRVRVGARVVDRRERVGAARGQVERAPTGAIGSRHSGHQTGCATARAGTGHKNPCSCGGCC